MRSSSILYSQSWQQPLQERCQAEKADQGHHCWPSFWSRPLLRIMLCKNTQNINTRTHCVSQYGNCSCFVATQDLHPNLWFLCAASSWQRRKQMQQNPRRIRAHRIAAAKEEFPACFRRQHLYCFLTSHHSGECQRDY